ncbi:hypothetical protein CC86DRAFT_401244 [Ophiobolus disseminans]|uniref:Uncharacterized protein n=1 Tax=Ophiobolus disseminans TaxID=1469910 RepID=A0A6A7AIH2_9PLEO|nr:hypothetical protein CC86DRAFT_401244 [Ophiobolus disseminans]
MAYAGYTEKPPHEVEKTERDVTPPPTPMPKPRRFWEKLGIYNIAVLALGTVAIALALAFLLFIWGASTTARISGVFPRLWFLIVRKDWAPRVITLSSVLIRVATAAQLGVFAAILAALILERVGVSTEDLPLVSMIRCLNSGPHSLAMSVAKSIFTRALMPYSVLIVLAILNAFALQFTSTILLNDFGYSDVVTYGVTDNVTIGLSEQELTSLDDKSGGRQNPYGGVDYWKVGPATYNRFAEYKEAGSQKLEYMDTGKTYRGFLPFRDFGERASLRNYTGPMTVVDTRVICVKPTLGNISFYGGDSSGDPSIRGALTFSDTHPDLIANEQLGGKGSYINCTIPTAEYFEGKSYANLSLCSIEYGQARLINGIKPDPDLNVSSGIMGQTSTFLLLQTTGNATEWGNSNDTLVNVQSSKPSWRSFRKGSFNLNLTACFVNPLPSEYEVQALSNHDDFDVELDWNATAKAYNSTSIRRMLGATGGSLSAEQRGLLRLLPMANWTAADIKTKHNISTNHFIWDTLLRYSSQPVVDEETGPTEDVYTQTTYFTENAHPERSVHRTHVEIFQRVFQETGDAGLALQALWTVLLEMAYYDFFPQYDVNATATFTSSKTINAPVQWRAMGAILGLLAIHTALIVAALVLFNKRTEMSLLGNAWQAVSQVMTTDTAAAVHHGATTTDREVRGSMRHGGAADGRIRIAHSVHGGRVEATAVRQRNGATYSAPVGHV